MSHPGSERAAVVQVDLPGRRIRLTPDRKAASVPDAPELLVVAGWCPKGRATAFTDNNKAIGELASKVNKLGRKALPAAVFDPAASWHLAAVAIEGEGLDDLGTRLAAFALQDRYRLVDADGITEVFVGTGFRRRTPMTVQDIAHRPCPILGDGESAPCRDPGGHWVAASMRASLRFRAKRHSALRAVGCDDCNAAGPPEGARGAPIAMVRVLDPAPRDQHRTGAVHGPGYGNPDNTPKVW